MTLWVLLPIYIAGVFISSMATGSGVIDVDDHEIVLWPLTFLKWLIKGLCKVLFTGWTD